MKYCKTYEYYHNSKLKLELDTIEVFFFTGRRPIHTKIVDAKHIKDKIFLKDEEGIHYLIDLKKESFEKLNYTDENIKVVINSRTELPDLVNFIIRKVDKNTNKFWKEVMNILAKHY